MRALIIIFCLCMASCSSSKKATFSPAEKQQLTSSIESLISCLNSRDFDCVAQYYSAEFISFNPVVIYNTTEEMILDLQRNYEQNKYQLAVEIGEVEAGIIHGHALLRWKMLDPSGEEIIDSMNLTIWKKSGKEWQLHRMLFFIPEK